MRQIVIFFSLCCISVCLPKTDGTFRHYSTFGAVVSPCSDGRMGWSGRCGPTIRQCRVSLGTGTNFTHPLWASQKGETWRGCTGCGEKVDDIGQNASGLAVNWLLCVPLASSPPPGSGPYCCLQSSPPFPAHAPHSNPGSIAPALLPSLKSILRDLSAWSSGVQIIPESMVLAELTGHRTCTWYPCQPELPPIHAQCKEQQATFLHFSSYLPGLLGLGSFIHRRVRFLTLFQAHASCWHLSCYFSLPKPLISILSFIISILLQTSGLCYSLLF